VVSLQTGSRGWNDYELTLYNSAGERLDPDCVDEEFTASVSPEQLGANAADAA